MTERQKNFWIVVAFVAAVSGIGLGYQVSVSSQCKAAGVRPGTAACGDIIGRPVY